MSTEEEQRQRRVFTKCMNVRLKTRDLSLNEEKMLTGGLDDGMILWNFCELISGKSLKKINPHPKFPIHKIDNLSIIIDFLRHDGLSKIDIGAEDILQHNTKLVLGLVWQIIYNYQIKPQSKKK